MSIAEGCILFLSPIFIIAKVIMIATNIFVVVIYHNINTNAIKSIYYSQITVMSEAAPVTIVSPVPNLQPYS